MESSKLLILEANKGLRDSRTRALSRQGYRVTSVSSFEEAGRLARRQSYDLLVIGAEEPESLRMLLPQLPPEMSVLMITRKDTVGRVAEQAGAGIHSFLIEPFRPAELKEKIAQAMDRARQVKEGMRSQILTSLECANWLVASETGTDDFFKRVVEISAANTGADYVSLSVRDDATGKLVTRAQVGDYEPAWKDAIKEMVETGEAVLLGVESHHHHRLRDVMARAEIAAVMSVPVTIKGDTVGAIGHIKATKGAPFTSADLNFACILGWGSSMALENARLFGKVQQQHRRVEKLLEELATAQENERRRVAVEIHDGVAQWMVGASYSIKACSSLISESRLADLDRELTRTRNTIQKSITELRRAIANLRPFPLEELGLATAVRQAAEALRDDGINCRFKVDRNLPPLTAAEENTTYWIVQETLTNVKRHSEATDVCVRMRYRDGMFSVEVSDNGRGFVPDQVMNSGLSLGQVGLRGMKERAELLGGSLTTKSEPGKGATITLAFPAAARETVKATA